MRKPGPGRPPLFLTRRLGDGSRTTGQAWEGRGPSPPGPLNRAIAGGTMRKLVTQGPEWPHLGQGPTDFPGKVWFRKEFYDQQNLYFKFTKK